ncbi:MAG: imidazolonepropionase [bacterium]
MSSNESPRFLTQIGTLALPRFTTTGVPQPPLELRHQCWLEIEDGRITKVGPEGESEPPQVPYQVCFSVRGRLVTPGFVDAHTHPAFVGFRTSDLLARLEGLSYHDIAQRGGGILSSVRQVRQVSLERLTEEVVSHFQALRQFGITALEAKSGYGLTVEDEIKSLRAIRDAAQRVDLTVSPTLLAAHFIPPEFLDRPDAYVDLIVKEMIPRVVEEQLADAVDVFVDSAAFSVHQARIILETARQFNLLRRIHGDQFSPDGSARLAAEVGAISADHMDWTPPDDYDYLVQDRLTVVLLPGAVFFLGKERFASAREMIRRGVRVALSTDFNPGSSPTTNLPLMLTLACLKMGLTPEQALWAATMGGAWAIDKPTQLGSLYPGYQADLAVWEVSDLAEIPYRFGSITPQMVMVKGRVVIERQETEGE